jgi:hypothetical protein
LSKRVEKSKGRTTTNGGEDLSATVIGQSKSLMTSIYSQGVFVRILYFSEGVSASCNLATPMVIDHQQDS